ncbi:ribosomal protein S16 [Isosphaera pallida ATCC 43644]|uniref:Small ribosomal subunit protein bS16 n=1 Tax=Isosphaera pallida (strain ATCC 43644 / DSM 9630 / IS1B) TaxID=575540 RepID=E8R2R6_ISOPI|nr:30S ribosomal protein S16 [Isosphaera pallida]ADV63563.1 ribosomal protein S16 [Isosphaera pallida ATCC 43644]
MVKIRMKSMGRLHRPFYRICAMDAKAPRDGRAIEELGYYDPMVRNKDARTVLHVNRVRYWLSVGAQPTEKVAVLLKKYGVTKPAPGEPIELTPEQIAALPFGGASPDARAAVAGSTPVVASATPTTSS